VVASNVNDRFKQSFWFFFKEMGWSFEVGQAWKNADLKWTFQSSTSSLFSFSLSLSEAITVQWVWVLWVTSVVFKSFCFHRENSERCCVQVKNKIKG
jgi:hypothetical protein